jgi:hypothetical protein
LGDYASRALKNPLRVFSALWVVFAGAENPLRVFSTLWSSLRGPEILTDFRAAR